MLELELPYPPTVNNYKKIGRTIKTKSGKYYQQRINSYETKIFYYEVWVIVNNLNAIKQIPVPLDKEISITVYLHPPDKRKRDIDNPIKVLLDSLVRAGLIKDDSQISRLLIERRDIIEKGKVKIRITEL